MKYISSDWHLGHIKTIEYSQRPFSSVDEMNDTILKNIFSTVKKGDDLYFLGDMSWEKDLIDVVLDMAAKRKVRFHWILGNHDNRFAKQYAGRIKEYSKHNSMHNMLEVKLTDKEGNHYPTVLCHFPLFTWNKSHYNSFLLFGHHHATTHGAREVREFELSGKKLNVNCEFFNYYPVNELEIIEIMKTRPNNWDFIDKGKKYEK